MNGPILVLMGGWSSERQVSLWSGETVLGALRAAGFVAEALDITSAEGLLQIPSYRPAAVFNVLHGGAGEDGHVQALLDLWGIPYPGCGVLASALAMDKLRSKQLWRALELPTADWRVIGSFAELRAAAEVFGYPFIVKPSADGSSVGISKVKAEADLEAAWDAARAGNGVVLAERFVPGAEYSCALIAGEALPLVRIEPDGEFYDYHAKYLSDATRYHCPSGLGPDREAALGVLARRAFEALGGAGWGRVDFLMGEDGQPWLLEANTLPGMTSHSLVPMAARAAGWSLEVLMRRIMATAAVGGSRPEART